MQKLISLLFFSNFLLAQNNILTQPTISSAGIHATGENTKLLGTVGQSFAGSAESDITILSSGFWGAISSASLGIDDLLPTEFEISNAYPNPFNPTVNIDFTIPVESEIRITIYDVLGRNIFNLKQDFDGAGKYRFQWHGLKDSGAPIASGVYLVSIQYKNNVFKQKITFLK